jgi:peptidoglycan hydrolase-like protein with peptidoglycan-binding domain
MARTKQTAFGRNINWTDDDGGLSLLGVDTIPTAGASYTDAKTVTAVQAALVKKGYNIGATGPNNDGVDGMFGPKTKAAIKKLQAAINADVNGTIDEGVIAALKVTPGVLPPGVTMAGRAAVQAQVALDAATAAEHAETPSDAQTAAEQLVTVADAAAPPPPPEVKEKVAAAQRAAHAATTPAEVKAAAMQIADAAADVHAAVKPAWYEVPAWDGGPPTWEVGVTSAAGAVGLGAILWGLLR